MDWVLLYDWQQLDKEARQLKNGLKQTEERREMERLQRQFQKEKAQLKQFIADFEEKERMVAAREGELAREKAEREQLNKELYSGSVTNPKELQAMEQQLALKDEEIAGAEAELVTTCNQGLTLKKQGILLKRKLEQRREKYEALKAQAMKKQEETGAKMQELERQKDEIWQKVSPVGQKWFTIHSARQEAPISILKKDICCKDCGMILPPITIKQIKAQPGTIRCEKCGKYLIDYVKE